MKTLQPTPNKDLKGESRDVRLDLLELETFLSHTRAPYLSGLVRKELFQENGRWQAKTRQTRPENWLFKAPPLLLRSTLLEFMLGYLSQMFWDVLGANSYVSLPSSAIVSLYHNYLPYVRIVGGIPEQDIGRKWVGFFFLFFLPSAHILLSNSIACIPKTTFVQLSFRPHRHSTMHLNFVSSSLTSQNNGELIAGERPLCETRTQWSALIEEDRWIVSFSHLLPSIWLWDINLRKITNMEIQ